MGSVLIVVLAVVLGHDFCFEQGGEYFDSQELVTQFPVEGFHVRVLPGCSGVNEADVRGTESTPVGNGIACHFGALVIAFPERFAGHIN